MQKKSIYLLIDWFYLCISILGIIESIHTFNEFRDNLVQFQCLLALFLILISIITFVDEVFFLAYIYCNFVSIFNGILAVVHYIISWLICAASFSYLIWAKVEYEDLFETDAAWGFHEGGKYSKMILCLFILYFIKYFDIWFWLLVKLPCVFLSWFFKRNSQKKFSFMTYNIQRGKDLYGEVSFHKQFDYIKKINPDVTFIQEGENLNYSTFVSDGLTILPTSNIDRHTLILTHGEVLFTEKVYFQAQDTTLDRTQYFLLAQVKVRDEIFWVLTSHLTAQLNMVVQIKQVSEIVDKLSQVAGSDSVIFGGDFNLVPFTHAIRYLNYNFTNTWGWCSLELFGFSAFLGSFVFPYISYYVQLDYIFTTCGKTKISHCYTGNGDYSDHKPKISHILMNNSTHLENLSLETINLNTSGNQIL